MDRDEAKLDAAIEDAVATAKPLFGLYGWTYWDSNETPSRTKMTNTIRELIRACDVELEKNCEIESFESQTGRFCVEVHGSGDIDIKLDLSSYYHPE